GARGGGAGAAQAAGGHGAVAEGAGAVLPGDRRAPVVDLHEGVASELGRGSSCHPPRSPLTVQNDDQCAATRSFASDHHGRRRTRRWPKPATVDLAAGLVVAAAEAALDP